MAECALATRPRRAGAAAFSASTSVNALVNSSHSAARLASVLIVSSAIRFSRALAAYVTPVPRLCVDWAQPSPQVFRLVFEQASVGGPANL
jgi:hypothetical protein